MSQVKDDLFDYLKEIGLMPSFDEDEDIVFMYNLLHCFVVFNDEDERFIQIVIPNIYDVDEDNREKVLNACNQVSRVVKVVKGYINSDDEVCIVAEFFLDDMPNYESFIPRAIRALAGARLLFTKTVFE